MIKIFWGDDTLRMQRGIDLMVSENSEAEYQEFREKDMSNLIFELGTQSFFTEKRFFVARKILSSKDIKGLPEALSKKDKNTVVIFVEEQEPPKKITEQIKAESKEYSIPKGPGLVKHIKETVTKYGGDIAPLAAERLAGFVGSDTWQLEEEIKKLVLYKTNPEGIQPIETADVDLLVHSNFEANIFNFVDAIAGKNARRAESLLNSFIESGENPLYLLSMITRQFRNISMVKFDDLSEADFARQAKVHPFVAKKTKQQSKNFSQLELAEVYKKLVWADLSLKSGSEPAQVLQKLIV